MEVLAVLFVLALIAGWFLGVIAFFKVLSARSEIAALRRRLEALASGDTAPASVPFVPPVVTEPAAEPPPFAAESAEPLAEAPPRPDIEALLTARWGVWLGAAALVLAGVFLVRYAVEQGLLGPAPRCVLAALLGLALLAAAEWLHRREAPQPGMTDQAPPALAAGGVAVLFGAAYGAGVLYELVPPPAAFVLLAAAALLGLAISLRHGQLVGAVGIVGAFVTPALVQTEHAVAAWAVRLPAARDCHRARGGSLHGLDLAGLGHDGRRRRLGAAGDRSGGRRRPLGACAVRAGCRRARSRGCCHARHWTTRSADAWPGSRARRWARPGCCWRCLIRAGSPASACCCSCR